MSEKLDPQGVTTDPNYKEPVFDEEVASKVAEEIKADKDQEKRDQEDARLLYNIGETKAAAFRAGTFSGLNKDSAKKDKENALAKRKAESHQIFQDFENKLMQADDDTYKMMIGAIAAAGRGYNAKALSFEYEGINAAIAQAEMNKRMIVDQHLSSYFTAKGNFNMAQMYRRVDDKLQKPTTSRGALDKLEAHGAHQFDIPEMPDDDKAILVEMITSSIGQMAMNVSALAMGGQDTVAAGLAEAPLQTTMDRVSTMLTYDVAQHREKKEKIKNLNQELEMKYQDNMLMMLADFEARADADERAYQTTRLNMIEAEIERGYRALGLKLEADRYVGEMKRARSDMKNLETQINTGEENKARGISAQMRNSAINATGQMLRAHQQAEELKFKLNLAGFDKLPLEPLFNAGVGTATGAARKAMNGISRLDPDATDTQGQQRNGGMLAGQTISTINEALEKGDITETQAGRIINNLLALTQTNVVVNRIDSSSMKILSREDIGATGNLNALTNLPDAPNYFRQLTPDKTGLADFYAMGLINSYGNKVKQKQKRIDSGRDPVTGARQ
jgi:hypothetical protein